MTTIADPLPRKALVAPVRGVVLALVAVLAASQLAARSATPAEIEGVQFRDVIRVSDDPVQQLRLHGMGLLRYRIVFRGYVAALYLPDEVSGIRALEDIPRRLELSYFWPIAASDFATAAEQLLGRKLRAMRS